VRYHVVVASYLVVGCCDFAVRGPADYVGSSAEWGLDTAALTGVAELGGI
jgi:hypothetical protein